jgi:hypothetical protein
MLLIWNTFVIELVYVRSMLKLDLSMIDAVGSGKNLQALIL